MSLKLLLLQHFKQNLLTKMKLTIPIKCSLFDKKIKVLDMLLSVTPEDYDMITSAQNITCFSSNRSTKE